ncbi:hypothetical protein [Pseudoduganella sp. OTU4001]|uniref:hypothetical protein n=1 Tax=Pseudoduganella sp. OTU4001 TaxID=3043854 RepID=UPI00313B4B4C
MKELVPADPEADSVASVDGYTYKVRVVNHGTGFRAHLSWQRFGAAKPSNCEAEQMTPLFSNPRSAMIEGHSLAEEFILAWRGTVAP